MSAALAPEARRLAGLAGVLFGWTPDIFWNATPAELAAMVGAVRGDPPGLDTDELARLMEACPDG